MSPEASKISWCQFKTLAFALILAFVVPMAAMASSSESNNRRHRNRGDSMSEHNKRSGKMFPMHAYKDHFKRWRKYKKKRVKLCVRVGRKRFKKVRVPKRWAVKLLEHGAFYPNDQGKCVAEPPPPPPAAECPCFTADDMVTAAWGACQPPGPNAFSIFLQVECEANPGQITRIEERCQTLGGVQSTVTGFQALPNPFPGNDTFTNRCNRIEDRINMFMDVTADELAACEQILEQAFCPSP